MIEDELASFTADKLIPLTDDDIWPLVVRKSAPLTVDEVWAKIDDVIMFPVRCL